MLRKGKEEDKTEKTIRGLLKEPENRRCINCNSLGPQYVCTTFWTFVCTNCSGVHREFSHRVKSVSMAKFKPEEISDLQAGGNERARQIYFKSWDPQRNFYPDASNLYKIREFIRHVYIDRKYAGQNSYDKQSIAKPDRKNDSNEQRSPDTSSFGARDEFKERRSFGKASNSGRDEYELRTFDQSSPSKRNDERNLKNIFEQRSPRHIQENVRPANHRSRPTRFEIVDDRFREDGSVKHYDRHLQSKESKSGSRSPGSQGSGKTSLPAIQPIQNIIGDKVPPLSIGEPPKANNDKNNEGTAKVLKVANATNENTTNEKQKEDKPVQYSSLIDFDANPEPTGTLAEPQAQTMASNSNVETSSAPSTATEKATVASKLDSVESWIFELSAPSVATAAPLNSSEATNLGSRKGPEVSNNVGTLAITVVENDRTLDSNNSNSMALVPSVPLDQSPQAARAGDGSKTSGRKELPMDLFASNFTAFTPAAPGWQMRPPHGIGYGMQFHPPVMPMASFPNPSKPSNPFDIDDNGHQVQAAVFPSMSSLQGAMPNMLAATALQPRPSHYATALSSHVSPYGMSMNPVPGAYMGQQPNNMSLTRPQGYGGGQDAFASINPIQQGNGTDSSPSATNSPFSRGRNPFG
ncbi:hypothetical protein ACJIZ3_001537 [Penstemon smallii]|uniref:Arf-GAP domain-containing protein n=1 Tax=Penstemon smallii TaxID=265156 RepID=A0ABD3U3V7_9LAMI